MLDRLESADLSPYLNQMVRAKTESAGEIELELIEVTDLGPDPPDEGEGAKRRPFFVIFRGPSEVQLPQGIYDIELADLGTLGLFIVPVGAHQDRVLYQALFN
jgi:hypothetical protein